MESAAGAIAIAGGEERQGQCRKARRTSPHGGGIRSSVILREDRLPGVVAPAQGTIENGASAADEDRESR